VKTPSPLSPSEAGAHLATKEELAEVERLCVEIDRQLLSHFKRWKTDTGMRHRFDRLMDTRVSMILAEAYERVGWVARVHEEAVIGEGLKSVTVLVLRAKLLGKVAGK
jgi:hypothetical protein